MNLAVLTNEACPGRWVRDIEPLNRDTVHEDTIGATGDNCSRGETADPLVLKIAQALRADFRRQRNAEISTAKLPSGQNLDCLQLRVGRGCQRGVDLRGNLKWHSIVQLFDDIGIIDFNSNLLASFCGFSSLLGFGGPN